MRFCAVLAMKTTKIAWISIFFRKKLRKVLVVQKKVVPLHPQSREMHIRIEMMMLNAEIAQLVEHNLAKVGVAGPSPVFRSTC